MAGWRWEFGAGRKLGVDGRVGMQSAFRQFSMPAHPASLSHPTSQPGFHRLAGSTPRAALSPGVRLLPRWKILLTALSRLGSTQLISRNRHLVAGGPAVYPFPAGPAGRLQLRPHLHAWHEGWYHEEPVPGQTLRSIEFRDRQGKGSHKLLLTADTDRNFARTLLSAFEQEPLAPTLVAGAPSKRITWTARGV